jgi:hypothetical protein
MFKPRNVPSRSPRTFGEESYGYENVEETFGHPSNICTTEGSTVGRGMFSKKGGATFGGGMFNKKHEGGNIAAILAMKEALNKSKGGATFGGGMFNKKHEGGNPLVAAAALSSLLNKSKDTPQDNAIPQKNDTIADRFRNMFSFPALAKILHHGKGSGHEVMHKFLSDLHDEGQKQQFHVTGEGATFGGATFGGGSHSIQGQYKGGNPLVAATAVQAVGDTLGSIMGPITEAVRSKSNWDFRGRELAKMTKDRNEMMRIMMQETDPDRILEYAKLLYQM